MTPTTISLSAALDVPSSSPCKMVRFTHKNYHGNTHIRIRPQELIPAYGGERAKAIVSLDVARRINRKICSIKDCLCGKIQYHRLGSAPGADVMIYLPDGMVYRA